MEISEPKLTTENRTRKRLIMRSRYRGIKEMDIIIGRFVEKNAGGFSLAQMQDLEDMLITDDQTLYAMILGHEAPYPKFKHWIKAIQADIQNH